MKSAIEVLEAEREITRLLATVAEAQDTKDWQLYRSCFTDRITVEQSLKSDVPAELSADEWTAGVASALSRYDVTHHHITHVVTDLDGDAARVTAHFVALHQVTVDGEATVLTVSGRYKLCLLRHDKGWKITHRGLLPSITIGDLGLLPA